MSNNTKIFSEAIAEAKAIRETAMANAKLALEEAFAPRIQEMMSDKLEAMSQEEDEMKEDYGQAEADAMNDEISLEELLAELEGLEEGKEEMEEGKEEMEEGKEEMDENTIAEAEDDDEVGTISVDELKDIIRDIMADVMGGGEEEEAGEEEMEAGEEEMEAGEDDLELEEILAEIANLEEGEELEEVAEYLAGAKDLVEMFPFLNMQTASLVIGALGAAGLTAFSAITAKVMDMALAGRFGDKGKAFAQKLQAAGGAAAKARNVAEGEDEEMEEGIGSAIKGAAQKIGKGLEKAYDAVGNAKPLPGLDKFEKNIDKGAAALKKAGFLGTNMTKGQRAFEGEELDEAMKTIATLRSELNEVNLLNAKLLYVNKLFKAKNLNEAQKVKVINAFDRAETVREAKNVFDTLNESLNTEKAKSQIKESLSFASKSAGVSDRQPIMEGDDFVNRMQKLAGII
jgi:hypothetical protein